MPAARPQLPSAERVLPYLRRIDDARVYTNWGPLTAELEARLAAVLWLEEGGVTTAASGTAALSGAILAAVGRASTERPLAILPAFTFTATAHAVECCGYVPYLADIDPDTWMLEPEALSGHPALDRAGVVVPVAPFGRPVRQDRWQAFRAATGVPVVIDGAASFDHLVADPARLLGEIPVTVSFHATKSFAAGEGGLVASTDTAVVQRAAQTLNFGVHGTRESRVPGLNGKMSEYHAAVGLAELDGWSDKRAALHALVERYRCRLAARDLAHRFVAWPEVSTTYVLFRAGDVAESCRVCGALADAGVGHRLWYERGLQAHCAFADAPRDRLGVTEEVAACLIGLPVAPDLPDETIGYVVEALAQGIGASR